MKEGARAMAMYAKVAQRNGLVPIIEPDIGRGGDHTVDRCFQVMVLGVELSHENL